MTKPTLTWMDKFKEIGKLNFFNYEQKWLAFEAWGIAEEKKFQKNKKDEKEWLEESQKRRMEE